MVLFVIGGYMYVLVDVSCSGDGMIRKDADVLVRWYSGIGNVFYFM